MRKEENSIMQSIELLDDEQLDDLELCGLRIIQKKDGFKFGTDAVLLSDFAKDIHSEHTLDLCSGTGIIPFLLYGKSKTKKYTLVEIQKDIAKMAKKSVELNLLCDNMKVVCEDLKNAVSVFGKRQFDLITCNPPYIRDSVMNENDSKTIARHEVMCTLEDIIKVSSELMKTTGRLAMVHRPSRIAELLYLMKKYKIEPKRMRFVQKTPSAPPILVLVEGLFGAKSDVIVQNPLILYNEDMTETSELKEIYGFLQKK